MANLTRTEKYENQVFLNILDYIYELECNTNLCNHVVMFYLHIYNSWYPKNGITSPLYNG